MNQNSQSTWLNKRGLAKYVDDLNENDQRLLYEKLKPRFEKN